MMPTQPQKRPVGRPRLDPTGKQNTHGVKLTPAEADYLRKLAGSVNAGIRKLVTTAMQS